MSSTCRATFGYLSQTQAPDSPYRRKANGDFISGPGLPLKTSIATVLPWLRSSSGLGSNRSTALGAPSMNSQMTEVALGAKCGGWGASGSPGGRPSPAAAPGVQSRSANAQNPSPAPARARKSRRVPGTANRPQCRCWSIHIDKLIHAEEHLGEVGEGAQPVLLGRLGSSPRRASPGLGLEEPGRRLALGDARGPGQGQPEAEGHAALRRRVALGQQAPRQVGGAVAEEPIVEQRQRLRRDGRDVAPA